MLEFNHKKDISDGRRTIYHRNVGEVFYMSDLKYTVPGKGIVEVKVEKSARTIAREERRRELAEKQAAREARWQKEKEKQELYRRLRQQDKQPVSATLICVQDTTGKNVLGTAVRGLVGGMSLGTFGAAVGITSARREVVAQSATFAVKYKSGRTGTETVDVGSKRFEELAQFLAE